MHSLLQFWATLDYTPWMKPTCTLGSDVETEIEVVSCQRQMTQHTYIIPAMHIKRSSQESIEFQRWGFCARYIKLDSSTGHIISGATGGFGTLQA